MKLDNAYFEKKAATLGWCQDGNIPAIIKQIARDAAEAQMNKCIEELDMQPYRSMNRSELNAAIRSAALAIPDGE